MAVFQVVVADRPGDGNAAAEGGALICIRESRQCRCAAENPSSRCYQDAVLSVAASFLCHRSRRRREPASCRVGQRGIHGGDVAVRLGARHLDVVAESEIQGEVRANAPVILREAADLPPAVVLRHGIVEACEVHAAGEEAGSGVASAYRNGHRVCCWLQPVPLSAVSEGSKVKEPVGIPSSLRLQPAHLAADGEIADGRRTMVTLSFRM